MELHLHGAQEVGPAPEQRGLGAHTLSPGKAGNEGVALGQELRFEKGHERNIKKGMEPPQGVTLNLILFVCTIPVVKGI